MFPQQKLLEASDSVAARVLGSGLSCSAAREGVGWTAAFADGEGTLYGSDLRASNMVFKSLQ